MNLRKTLLPFVAAALCSIGMSGGATLAPTNALLFVTQVPVPFEVNDNTVSNVQVSVVSPLGNHLADTLHAPRGGDLWIRYPNGALKNLTRAAGFGTNGVQHGIGIAVRDPFVHWSGNKAIFSMVVGAPTSTNDTAQFFWQLYEITNLGAVVANSNVVPAIVKVSNQPTNYNNVMPCYGTDGRIIFVCDRPRNGAAHLYPQLDEYNDIPSNTGLWSFDPATGDLIHLDHSPSGDFNPFVDSFGRVIFTRWDHLVQDRNATGDRLASDPNAQAINKSTNGTFNYFDESSTNYDISYRPDESFPEPRTYDAQLLAQYGVQGNVFNSFLPWMQNEDGTGLEVLNHIGRHELFSGFRGSSFTNDLNLVQQFSYTTGSRFNSNSINNFMEIREDPLNPGTYFAIDSLNDFGTHGSGQIVALYGPPGVDGEHMYVTYITPRTTTGPNAFGVYRNAVPLSNGGLVASYTTAPSVDSNIGTATNWKSIYNYRLMLLSNSAPGALWTTNQYLTMGLSNNVGFYVGTKLVTNTSPLWEIEAVEVAPHSMPTNHPVATVASVEAQVFAEEGVPIPDMQTWLRSNNLALIISRNVTKRDRADREQPFNLRIPFAGGTQTIATNGAGNNSGKIYDIGYIQFLQGDQLRGLTLGTTNPVPGRRVLATPMHDFPAPNFNVPITNNIPGATRLGLDGSQATFLPARRAMTHQTVNTNGQEAVRERYWITYQPGEIRTCAVCHGLNQADQRNQPLPTNSPAALRSLLRYWKDQTGYAKILSAGQTNGGFRVNVSGGTARTNVLEASSNLTQNVWAPILTNSGSTNGLYWLLDPNTNQAQRFYRISAP